jgi:hypothetical protein
MTSRRGDDSILSTKGRRDPEVWCGISMLFTAGLVRPLCGDQRKVRLPLRTNTAALATVDLRQAEAGTPVAEIIRKTYPR